jgi:hypothetical protein
LAKNDQIPGNKKYKHRRIKTLTESFNEPIHETIVPAFPGIFLRLRQPDQ